MRRGLTATLCLGLLLQGGCTALLTGGKDKPPPSAGLGNTLGDTHCDTIDNSHCHAAPGIAVHTGT